ncbi:MAG TPA: metallophosphoesterase family protein [Candidatus Dormibacteraeota bacterium]|jgi:putative phosphoesterase
MKVGLIADTQGSFDVEALLRHVALAFAGVDEIWHAGDWGDAAVLEGLKKLGRLVVVNGNVPEDSRYPLTIEGTIGRWRVGMIHNLDARRQRWAQGFDVVIHGHTHRWRDEVIGRTRFINPGTATRPQFGGTERTIARLSFEGELVVEKLLVPKFPKRPGI